MKDASASLRRALRPVAFGTVTSAALFLGGFGAWSAYAPLSGAAIAPGIVSPDSSRKTVQHLEGGIVQEILVLEGDHVEQGAVLLRLSTAQARASFNAHQRQLRRLEAERIRLLALEQRHDRIDWPPSLVHVEDADYQAFLDNQSRMFDLQRRSVEEQKSILQRRKAQLRQEIAATERENEGLSEQIRIIGEEMAGKERLVENGLLRKPELLALERGRAQLRAKMASNEAMIAQSGQKIEETEISILSSETDFNSKVSQEMERVGGELAQVEEDVAATEDTFRRTEIRAPASGTVMALRMKTTGGIIRPGEPILDIVPDHDALVIEARLNPNDIEAVAPGLPARVHLAPYSSRTVPPLTGTVIRVSPDVIVDDNQKQTYYAVRVEVAPGELEHLARDVELRPGMRAEVFIISRQRTFFEYLAEPVQASFRRAFREHY
ncbi:HlyD family type I secretion periplasmic adaptor subunit [Mesorhizobium sp.]|uniref:HlyD family type I secretion periplasmic adaptor subunit n=1 Tax=Mesorhizobium sp. TaxID=1871066 RepID=UPI001217BAB1|nr:HlyD family type I secretion periplasmic adaptor subunit [Mesorhizobium sp.]TIS49140.1 MAG: HlyD family type I secretion periplasmic adaptor subunit [Mesorhizobium sp.]